MAQPRWWIPGLLARENRPEEPGVSADDLTADQDPEAEIRGRADNRNDDGRWQGAAKQSSRNDAKPDRRKACHQTRKEAWQRADGKVSLDTPDRKSTRLNSSHLVISYAVFCLI